LIFSGEFSDDLQELKLKLWTMGKCNSSKAWKGQIAEGYVCAGWSYKKGIVFYKKSLKIPKG
jgi:hypothetical protein